MPSQRRDNLLVIAVVGVCIALLGAVFAVGLAARAVNEKKTTTVAAGASTGMQYVDVTVSEFKIIPATITVNAGAGMLRVTNKGTMAHNVTIVGQNLATSNINPGANETLDVMSLAAGSYQVICSVPGHKESGMTATLVVAGSGTTAGNTSVAAAPTMTVEQMDAMMEANMKSYPAKTQGLGAQLLAPTTILPDGTKQFDLTAKVVKWEVSPGKFVDAWTYNGTVPGPTIHVNVGDKVAVVLHNELPESTVIHFHGITVPNAMDGVPYLTQPAVKPGQSFTYSFVAQGPAVGMYHSHYDAVKQVANGLAGAFLIGEEPLPNNVKPSQELTMMLDDTGNLGITINGKSFPATAPVVAKYGDYIIVHYMNEGQMFHPMHLHGIPQLVVAEDGFPLTNPQMEDTVEVGPGQRFTVLIKADQLGAWAWHCHILSHAENDTGMYGMVTALIVNKA